MDRTQMLKQLKAGKDPLEISIKKWKDITNGKGNDFLNDNCALCEKFRPLLLVCSSSCPIKNKTGQNACHGTPFNEWIRHQQSKHEYGPPYKVRCNECKRLAQTELDFLESLQPKRKRELRGGKT